MLEESAKVVAVRGDRLWVETQSRSACSHCSSTGCGTSVISKLFGVKRNRLELHNSLSAKPGEQVMIGIPDEVLVRASVWAYLVPIIVMLLLTATGARLGMAEGLQVLLALSGLASGFILVHWITRRGSYRQGFKPHLLRTVGQESVRVEMPNHERSQP
jgi:sigma-E factor negative regulatory protein RseC